MSREVMQMALDALEELQGLCTDADDGCLEAITIYTPEAITALREALAAPRPASNLNCKSEQARLATLWGYVKAQPEQEPVAGQGKALSERLKLCARNVAFAASGRVDMSLAAMQEMFALIDHVCVGLDSAPLPQQVSQPEQATVADTGVNSVALRLALNSLRRGSPSQREIADELELSAIRRDNQPPQRQPLTDEQISVIVREAAKGSAIRRDGSTSHRIARAVEQAHGITGEKK